MSFSLLALVVLVGLLGPLLAARASWRVPVVVGELAGGLLIGTTGLRLVDPTVDDFRLLANIGFGLTMVVVGSHIPVKDPAVRGAIGRGALGAVAVGVVSAVAGIGIAALFDTGHAAVYGVLLASSSGALVLPMLRSLGVRSASVAQLVAQIALADIACVVALPLVVAPERALGAAVGAVAIALVATVLGVALTRPGRERSRRALHRFSERHRFAMELRLSLLVLFVLAAIAQAASLSIMLAGFALGLVLAAVGEPHRLARQLFGITEGFFGPLFFVWLGASLDLRSVVAHPAMIALGVTLGVGAVVVHGAARAAGLPWPQAVAAAGQLGVPVAAVTLGIQAGTLRPGEGAAILLGALVTVGVSAAATGAVARRRRSETAVVPA
ncbi:Na(+)/H(+)-K(+) antiporter GerN [Frondihabitans sp. 762G35]|uniref:cation:proton antiporter n=1 Tax=Frondihabitans sp. 762G35 TaxID=1446794 RepID=UPI000D217DED|nr:cation:proton antiporter [Frondihabitans sp. 762G35]ARC58370.1 Na(+)/H(+)-K(+) antiporter GerN [Frondihabitans sp. 762G35]